MRYLLSVVVLMGVLSVGFGEVWVHNDLRSGFPHMNGKEMWNHYDEFFEYDKTKDPAAQRMIDLQGRVLGN